MAASLRRRLAAWAHRCRFTRLSGGVTDLAVVAALSRCTPGARRQLAGRGVATGIVALLRADRGRPQGLLSGARRLACERVRCCSNLHGAAVTLLPGLQESVSTHGPSVDAVSGGSIEQTGGVDLL